MKPNQIIPFILILFYCFSCNKKLPDRISLAGEWQFQTDPGDVGEAEKWFEKDLPETVKLPGSMVENGKGDEVTLETRWTGGIMNPNWFTDPNYAPYQDSSGLKFPFWLQPDKKYTGAAWYRRSVIIPEKWDGKPVFLHLERVHWESTVWINGEKLEMQNSLGTPHVYNVSPFLETGENIIAVRVDNRTKAIDPGENSHSISDHTQSNWNGMVGDLSLQAKGEIYFETVDIFPDAEKKMVNIRAIVFNTIFNGQSIKIDVSAKLKSSGKKVPGKTFVFDLLPNQNIVKMSFPLGDDALLWDEFHPNLYELALELKTKKVFDRQTIDFGLRDFKVDGTRFAINGRPVFLRGTLECAIFPKTGYPPTQKPGWEKVFAAVKAHGLNHVRFHSWCPPEAAFQVADSMGVYLQVECSSWANQSTQLGSAFPIDQYVWDESKRIVKAYGNHPSFVMMAYGNEPRGPRYHEYLTEFVTYWKKNDPRRVYTGAAGWPALEVNDYHNLPQPRIQGWGEELNSIINAEPPRTDFDWSDKLTSDGIPVVSHEIGQWCVYPNFKEIEKYTGPLKAKNFELFRESLSAHGMGALADSFLLASGKLQALCYKAEIEAALRTPGFAGFHLLDLHDFPGQGTALVGVLDPFWEEKGYISPEEYRRFCNSTVPLARLGKRIFTESETLAASVEVAHFGEKPLEGIIPTWKMVQDGSVVAEGTLGQQNISIGNNISLGKIEYSFQKENRPRKMTLEIAVAEFSNSWDIWVYPEMQDSGLGETKVVEKLDRATLQFLENGGKVLLSLGRGKVSPEMGGTVGVGFSSIFWNTAWTSNQKPHTLGILCDPKHPALELFPTEYYSNWQWQDAMSHADAVQLDSFPATLKPIVRIIDNWVTNRPLALLFEAKVGEGSILVSGANLVSNLENRPEARQLRTSLLHYMTGEKFNPAVELTATEIGKIIR
jgi:hypothetical protein